jgi:hypothetical protein
MFLRPWESLLDSQVVLYSTTKVLYSTSKSCIVPGSYLSLKTDKPFTINLALLMAVCVYEIL